MTKGAPAQQTFRLAAFAMAIALCPAPAVSQSLDCNRLRAQIAATPVQTDSRAVAAAQKQRAELQHIANYAEQIGCNRRQFLFFGSQPPPQCGQIEARMATMRGNLDRLQNAVEHGSARRNNLLARYNQLCTRQATAPRTFFDQLFGGGGVGPDPEDLVTDDFQQPEETGPRRGSKAVCVRTCDGYFFPVSYNASIQSPDRLSDICSAQCPAADTQVFTYSPSRDITDAVSISGEPYTSLANALKYRRTFDAACTCRPKGKGWAETLAPAERFISSGRKDVIVTPEKAEELSRPRQPAPPKAPANGRQPGAQTQGPGANTTNELDRLSVTGSVTPEDVRRVRRVGPAL